MGTAENLQRIRSHEPAAKASRQPKRLFLLLILALPLFAATTVIDCGSPSDALFTGGTAYTIPHSTTTFEDSTLRFSYSPFSYKIQVIGPQQITLYFVEPSVSQPGQRVFSVSVNGQPVIDHIDLVAEAPALVAKGVSIQRTFWAWPDQDGFIKLVFTPNTRAAVVSSITLTPIADLLPVWFPRAILGPCPGSGC